MQKPLPSADIPSVVALPRSATSNLVNSAGLLGFFIVFQYFRGLNVHPVDLTLVCCLVYFVVILIGEVAVLKSPWLDSTGLNFAQSGWNIRRIGIKLYGLLVTFVLLGAAYWVFPVYRDRGFETVWLGMDRLIVLTLLFCVPYVAYVDRVMRQPCDGLYRFGEYCLGRRDCSNDEIVKQYLLGWLVKGFFWPIMFSGMVNNIRNISGKDFDFSAMNFVQFYSIATQMLYTIDLLTAVVGYLAAFRLIGTHLRSTEPTGFGWVICIICYPPFLSIFMNQYLSFSSNDSIRLLEALPLAQQIMGSCILLALTCYVVASLNFGCRFSNMTHRGIITNGAYRFTKHPAYVSKCSLWWMIHVPFYSTVHMFDAFRFTLLMMGISAVYYLRARTEERHLSFDPDYVSYAVLMNERSIFRGLAKWVPFLRYKPPLCWDKKPVEHMSGGAFLSDAMLVIEPQGVEER